MSVKQKAICVISVVGELSTNSCKAIIEIFLFINQVCDFGFKFFETIFVTLRRKWPEDRDVRGGSNNNYLNRYLF